MTLLLAVCSSFRGGGPAYGGGALVAAPPLLFGANAEAVGSSSPNS